MWQAALAGAVLASGYTAILATVELVIDPLPSLAQNLVRASGDVAGLALLGAIICSVAAVLGWVTGPRPNAREIAWPVGPFGLLVFLSGALFFTLPASVFFVSGTSDRIGVLVVGVIFNVVLGVLMSPAAAIRNWMFRAS